MSGAQEETQAGVITTWLTNKDTQRSAVISEDGKKWWLVMDDGVREFDDYLEAVTMARDLLDK